MNLEYCTNHPTMQYNSEHYCPQCVNEGLVKDSQSNLFEVYVALADFVPEFMEALTAHLKDKASHWGSTWLQRTGKGLNDRIASHLMDKCERHLYGDITLDWLSVAGDAMIAWIRANHPEIGRK